MTVVLCFVVLAGLNVGLLRVIRLNVVGCDWRREQDVRDLMRASVRLDVRDAVERAR
jgi:hypothetical protein